MNPMPNARHLAPLVIPAVLCTLVACRDHQAAGQPDTAPYAKSYVVPADGCRPAAKTVTVTLKANFFKELDSPSLCNVADIRVDQDRPDAIGSRVSCLAGVRPAVATGDRARPLSYATPLDLDIASLFPHNTQTMTAQIRFVLDTSLQNAIFLPNAADPADSVNAIRIDAEPDAGPPTIACRSKFATTPTTQSFGFQVSVPRDIGIKITRRYSIAVVLGTKQGGFYVPVIIDPKIPNNGTH